MSFYFIFSDSLFTLTHDEMLDNSSLTWFSIILKSFPQKKYKKSPTKQTKNKKQIDITCKQDRSGIITNGTEVIDIH